MLKSAGHIKLCRQQNLNFQNLNQISTRAYGFQFNRENRIYRDYGKFSRKIAEILRPKL